MKISKTVLDCILPLLCGTLLIFILTPYGPGTTPDSVSYLNFSFTSSLTGNSLFAPIYPTILALLPGTPLEKLGLVTYLNAIVLAVSLCLMIKTLRERVAPLALIPFLITLPAIWHTHRHCLSEPIFILLEILFLKSLFSITKSSPKSMPTTLLSVILPLTRFAGLSFALCAALVTYFSSRRIVRALLPLLAFLPFPLWILLNGTVGTRVWSLHLPNLTSLSQVPISIAGCFVAGLTSDAALTAGFLILATLPMALLKDVKSLRIKISALAIVLNIILIWISKAFLDANIPFNLRIFAPLFVPFFFIISELLIVAPSKARRLASIVLVIVSLTNGYILIGELKQHFLYGHGYTTVEIRDSESIKHLSLNHSGIIISNFPDALSLYVINPVVGLAERYSGQTLAENKLFPSSLDAQLRLVREGKAVLYYFRRLNWRRYLPSEDEISQGLQDSPLASDQTGAIYGRR